MLVLRESPRPRGAARVAAALGERDGHLSPLLARPRGPQAINTQGPFKHGGGMAEAHPVLSRPCVTSLDPFSTTIITLPTGDPIVIA